MRKIWAATVDQRSLRSPLAGVIPREIADDAPRARDGGAHPNSPRRFLSPNMCAVPNRPQVFNSMNRCHVLPLIMG